MKEMGFNRKPTILVFDEKSGHLYRFDFEKKSMTKSHSYPDSFRTVQGKVTVTVRTRIQRITNFPAVTFDEYICLFDARQKSNYRLEYCDVTAKWEKMSLPDGIELGFIPCITASSDAIFLVGSGEDRFTFKYNPPLDRWERLPDTSIDKCQSAVYSNGYLYCISLNQSNNKVERLNLETMKWERMADTNRRGDYYVAVECVENIYVIEEIFGTDIFIEKYDPKVDKWTELKPVTISDLPWQWIRNAFAIYGDLYLVGEAHILKYDVKKNELGILASFPDMKFLDSVLVRMSD